MFTWKRLFGLSAAQHLTALFSLCFLQGSIAFAGSGDLTIASVYPRFASLKDAGHREFACKLEATMKRYEKSSSAHGNAGTGAADANEALKGATFAFSMRAGECTVTEAVSSTNPKTASLAHAVAAELEAECAKLSLHYFKNPLADYARDLKLAAQDGFYRIGFVSGDYKLVGFLSPDLRVLREYSDGKENRTDIAFKQEGEKLAPSSLAIKSSGGKTARLEGLSYEIKKGGPILSGFKALLEDADFSQEIAVKLSSCKLD